MAILIRRCDLNAHQAVSHHNERFNNSTLALHLVKLGDLLTVESLY